MNAANETIHASYFMVKMPDGQEVMMHKLKNGKWVDTEERLAAEKAQALAGQDNRDFMARFDDTERKPHTDLRLNTATVTLDPAKVAANLDRTHAHIDAYLGEILGDPTAILNGTVKVREVVEPGIRRHAERLAGMINSPTWNRVFKEHIPWSKK